MRRSRTSSPHDCAPARRGSAGFSMIEALIAAGILLIIAVGLLPLFSRALKDNLAGNDATQSTNNSRTRVEEMLGIPFNNQALVIPVGATTQTFTSDFWAQGNADQAGDANEGWWAIPSGKGTVFWTRTTRVRQYSVYDLTDGDFDTPLPGNTLDDWVHFKEIEVVINNQKQIGSGQGIMLRGVRPF